MIKFPSIEQFRTVIRNVQNTAQYVGKGDEGNAIYDRGAPMPVLKFKGTTKLHGTNAGIVRDMITGEIEYQSRERVLTLEQDNAGFMLYMKQHEGIIEDITNQVQEIYYGTNVAKVCIYGEWCGKGIQKGIAISELEKMFVIFGVRVIYNDGDATWFPIGEFDIHYPEQRIFNIDTFATWNIEIDFANPQLAQNTMIAITEKVEEMCPVGKYFGVEGVGEGVVWAQDERFSESSGTWFKVKGEKHSVSKVKTLNPVDVEALKALQGFVDATVTEGRLEWALDNMQREKLLPFEMKSMGDFIRIVYSDVMKEEADTIVAAQLDPKKLGGPIANKARPWFVNKINNSIVRYVV